MTPQQYDKINGLNALGGCLWSLCLVVLMPVVFTFTRSPLLALIVGGVAMFAVVWGITKAKENV